jgi:hypothetical protein
VSEREKELAAALAVALQTGKRLLVEIDSIKKSLQALQDSVASGKPPLPYEDALRQGSADHAASGHTPDEALALIDQVLDRVQILAK